MQLPGLNLPAAEFRIRKTETSSQIFDIVRRRFVALTPEEWVRQHFIRYLISEKKYPASMLGIEMKVKVNTLSQRADIVVFNSFGNPWMIIECKSPDIVLDENVFYQAARYNLPLNVQFFVVTNGMEHYCLAFNGSEFIYLEDLPEYGTII